jgi:hypothetical protein
VNYKLFSYLFSIFSIIIAANLTLEVSSAGNTSISPTPQYANGSAYQSLTVNISIQDVTNLSSWQVKLSFNPHIINCTAISIPTDNIFSGYTTTFGYNIDNKNGSLEAFNGIWSTDGVNGSGKLCSITFQALSPGISALSFLSDTYLMNPDNKKITFESYDGTIQINQQGFNLYTFNVTSGGTPYNITVFSNSTVTVFQFNSTNQKMTFNASGTAGTAGSCTVSIPRPLLNGTFAVLIDDTSVHHTVSISNSNQYLFFNYPHTTEPLEIKVLTTIIGDLNGDRNVDMRDVAIVARAFGTILGDTRWDPRADINGPNGYPDGKVDMRDIALVAREFGNTWTTS